jgi:hypothetical protein
MAEFGAAVQQAGPRGSSVMDALRMDHEDALAAVGMD